MIKKYCEIIYRERRLQLHLVTSKNPLIFLGFLDFGPCNHLFLVTKTGCFPGALGPFSGLFSAVWNGLGHNGSAINKGLQ